MEGLDDMLVSLQQIHSDLISSQNTPLPGQNLTSRPRAQRTIGVQNLSEEEEEQIKALKYLQDKFEDEMHSAQQTFIDFKKDVEDWTDDQDYSAENWDLYFRDFFEKYKNIFEDNTTILNNSKQDLKETTLEVIKMYNELSDKNLDEQSANDNEIHKARVFLVQLNQRVAQYENKIRNYSINLSQKKNKKST